MYRRVRRDLYEELLRISIPWNEYVYLNKETAKKQSYVVLRRVSYRISCAFVSEPTRPLLVPQGVEQNLQLLEHVHVVDGKIESKRLP